MPGYDPEGLQPDPSAGSGELAELYRQYFDELSDSLRATYGNGPPDPEDVAQHAFERLGRRMDEAPPERPKGFLWICARNIIMDAKRAERVRHRNGSEVENRFFVGSSDSLDPERVFMAGEQLRLVEDVLRQMPKRRRQIFVLARVHGLTPAAAGKRVGVSRTSAVRHIALATEEIAKALAAAGAPIGQVGGK